MEEPNSGWAPGSPEVLALQADYKVQQLLASFQQGPVSEARLKPFPDWASYCWCLGTCSVVCEGPCGLNPLKFRLPQGLFWSVRSNSFSLRGASWMCTPHSPWDPGLKPSQSFQVHMCRLKWIHVLIGLLSHLINMGEHLWWLGWVFQQAALVKPRLALQELACNWYIERTTLYYGEFKT